MEYHSGGELWNVLNTNGNAIGCDEATAQFYAADIVNMMEYMKDNGIVHR